MDFVHNHGYRKFVLGYADDLCLLANSNAVLLAKVKILCALKGLELNVDKTVMQGIHYGTGSDL